MKKNLVIVESPAKAKTLEKFLGKEFKVVACGGHVRDLPAKKLGVDIEKDFAPTYQVIKGKEKTIKLLKNEAKKAKAVFLAPDPDREGEAIAWHLSNLIGDKKVKRIEFNEITKQAVLEAVNNPREINVNRVDAQQARRILDRLVGYKLSPLLWKKIRKGLSAGRVQSVAVRLICEREKEIQDFKSEEYWSIEANLSPKQKNDSFTAKLIKKQNEKIKISSQKEANNILMDLEGADYLVSGVTKKERQKYPAPPFITSTLQQEAARKLGFSAKKCMAIAQQLYEGVDLGDEGRVGLITYMRTDSVRIADVALSEVRNFIEKEFGKKYLPEAPRFYKRKKQAQDAHEAVRPTSSMRKPETIKKDLTLDQLKLYTLIWKRFVACQMASAVIDQTSVDISAGEYLFRATGSVIKFDGFIVLYVESRDEGAKARAEEDEGAAEEETAAILPELSEGEQLKLLKLLPSQHFTEPPPRYTEASLVKELEEKGIGRPSTYAPIMSTIIERGYVEKEQKVLKPTELGFTINGQLVKHFPNIVGIEFTAHMEDDLDDILEGKLKWQEALREFYMPFEKDLKNAEVNMEKIKKEVLTEEVCPRCGKKLMIRSGRFGDFLACSGFPKCKYTKNLETGEKKEEASGEVCEKCGKPMVLKHSRFGSFLACSGYPECKNVRPITKKTGVKCPKCGGELIERRSKRGRPFYGCENYPKCDFALWDRPLNEKCTKCGSLLVEKKQKGGIVKKCSNSECDYTSNS